MILIRPEQPEDVPQVRQVHQLAFGTSVEADLVDRLRQTCADSVSLVAAAGGVLGHILFTPVAVEASDRRLGGMGLGPMAVRPEWQRRGIGSQLVRRGLDLLRERGCPFVVVVGHPEYYPRFGFEPASGHGLRCQWDDVPDAAFMLLVLQARPLLGLPGVARYRDEFSEIA